MFKRNHGAGIIALAFTVLIVFLGCPMGIITDMHTPSDPAAEEQAAQNLATAWGSNVTRAGTTVTLLKDIKVVDPSKTSSSLVSARSAGPGTTLVEVYNHEIPSGVTLKVPAGRTLQVAVASSSFKVTGIIQVDKGDSNTGGTLIVDSTATIEVSGANAQVKVEGILGGTGRITVKSAGKIDLTSTASVTNDSNVNITADSTGAVTVDNGVTNNDKVSISGAGTINVPGTLFNRSSHAGTYTLLSYSAATKKAQLKAGETTAAWYDVSGDTALQTLFDAIYTPNAPGSAQDTFVSYETGKTAVPYTDANKADLSDKVLALFNITIGANSANDKVKIKGTDLPAATLSTGATNLVIIDIGKPGVTNTGLPKFSIPDRELGASSAGEGAHSHIRLRVNEGADLTILADNSGYPSGTSCPTGYFMGGCVEVMAGGKLRDGAKQGFPLGSNAVILNWAGSYLSVGEAADFGVTSSYYSGYLIGPSASQPRIEWANTTGYIEVRDGELAIEGNVTVKKTLGLIYSVWFIGNTTVTINIPSSDPTPISKGGKDYYGLFANEPEAASNSYNFYGTSNARIVLESGGIHKAFLTAESADNGTLLVKNGATTTITGTNTGTVVYYPEGTATNSGYPAWTIDGFTSLILGTTVQSN
ncbi:MAG: hypothetical protein LBG25_02350 [Spirochaetaceae bacterium]|jgi:hypothetical protein|nr:hypothetical protein [Spirochaetaceae bacterium]